MNCNGMNILYYQQGQHFDWGYLENPPLLSYLGMISSWLGGSVFWIKFWPSLFGSLTLIVSCLLTAEFGGKRFAQFIVALSIITGAFLRVHSLFQPNILDIFFWTLSIYCIVRYINSGQIKFLYLLCASLALGFLSKYSIVFIAASLILKLFFLVSIENYLLKRNSTSLSLIAFLISPAEYLVAIQPQLAIDPSYAGITGNTVTVSESCGFYQGPVSFFVAGCICMDNRVGMAF